MDTTGPEASGTNSSSFVVCLDDDAREKQKKKIPKRFQSKPEKPAITQQQIDAKLQNAEKRRKEIDQEKQERVRLVHEQCLHINQAAESLLAQDALRRGHASANQVKPMSRREIKQQIDQLQTGLKKLDDIGNTKLSYDYQED